MLSIIDREIIGMKDFSEVGPRTQTLVAKGNKPKFTNTLDFTIILLCYTPK